MKKTLIHSLLKGGFLALLLWGGTDLSIAQISFGGKPATLQYAQGQLRSAAQINYITVMPDFNPEDLKAANAWNSAHSTGKAQRIGRAIDLPIDFAQKAQPYTLSNGLTVYRLAIDVRGALASNLYFDDFFIPENGGELYIYTPDYKEILGKYTYHTHPEHGIFATQPLSGARFIMEYVPYNTPVEMPSIKIASVGHIFVKAKPIHDPGEDDGAEDCAININCPEGAAWQDQKAGVVQVAMKQGKNIGACSGNLINNTNEDLTPYIITAAHCENGKGPEFISTAEDLKQWIFTFHYEKVGCGNGSFALGRSKAMVGCEIKAMLAFGSKSDGLLLKLNQPIPPSYRVYYNGWDRSTDLPKGGASIHHPMGDAKRISILAEDVRLGYFSESGSSMGYTPNSHFRVHYKAGETEGGSSGSSLFNQEKLVVGTLSGGGGRCQKQVEYYGRLAYHWDHFKKEGDSYSQMAPYLDPQTNGAATKIRGRWYDETGYLRPLPHVEGLEVKMDYSQENAPIQIVWKAVPREHLAEAWTVTYRIYRNGIQIAETDKLEYSEPREEAEKSNGTHGSVVYGVQAVFHYNGAIVEAGDETEAATDIMEAGIHLANQIVNSSIKQLEKGNLISWRSPRYLQEVSHFGKPHDKMTFAPIQVDPIYIYGDPPYKKYDIASRFPTDQLVVDKSQKMYINGLRFMPCQAGTSGYGLYAQSGRSENDRVVVHNKETFSVPQDWKPGEWVTIYYEKPILIDPDKMFAAGITIPNDGKEYIAYIENTEDDRSDVLGCTFAFLNGTYLYSPINERIKEYVKNAPKGYLAITLLISNSPERVYDNTDKTIYASGRSAVTIGKISSYHIYRNNEFIAKTSELKYNDTEGKATDSYTVVGVVEKFDPAPPADPTDISNEGIAREHTPYVYPSALRSDARLNVVHSHRVQSFVLYSDQGERLMEVAMPSNAIDLSMLPSGAYWAVLQTEAGNNITQRITK